MTKNQDRTGLSRERVLHGAVELADEIGIESFTMRRLAEALETAPMTIYHHVPSKEEIIDGMVEVVFSEIEKPPADEDWKTAIRKRCVSAREVLSRHPWAAPLMESRTSPGPENLAHHESVLGCFRRGGLSVELAAHAYAILDSYLYGFAFEEATLPGGSEDLPEVAAAMAETMPLEDYPHLAELTTEYVLQPGYDFGNSFEFGLDLIIEGLDRAKHEN